LLEREPAFAVAWGVEFDQGKDKIAIVVCTVTGNLEKKI